MRVLMITSPSATHFLPMVPLAWAIRAAGHEILVAAQPDALGAVERAGLNAVSVGDPAGINDALQALVEVRPGQRPLEWVGRWTTETFSVFPPVWLKHSQNVLPGYLELAKEYRPDLILADVMECNALMVGEALGIPVAHHRYGVDPVSEPIKVGARTALREQFESLGLTELPEPTVVIDPCPAELQLPGLPAGIRMRYVPFNGSGTMPAWLRDERRAKTARRRVAVSLGSHTLSMSGVPLLRNVLRAFEAQDVEIVATVEERYREELGPVSSSVRLVEPLPLHLLLSSCDAVVHHGGNGTGMTSTSFGLPQIALPQIADSFGYGDQLAASGAGITIDNAPQQDDPVHLRKAAESLLEDPSYAQSARKLGQAVADLPSPAETVTELVRVAEGVSA
ncbi:nucleotide disphospho-sugar-binding domain-containing protein [Streptomyces sp. NPDC088725]|uniref:nucleotide disphospho-sugar-binding domain-containing protein n=1 Tax=Streptomyces sp. NPDC088725 TaxID=3365873 RepID=UPI00380FD1EC